MHRNWWNQTIYVHMQNLKSLYIFVSILFLMGVIFGAVVVNSLDPQQKGGLLQYLGYFFRQLNDNHIAESGVVLQHAIGDYLKTIGLLWILGLSVLGIPIILILLFMKGLVIGFTVGFLVNQLSWEGLWFASVAVVPQNLLAVPALIIVVVSGISFSILLVRNRLIRHRGTIYPQFISFSLISTAMGILLLFAAVIEAYLSPWLMKEIIPQVDWVSTVMQLPFYQ